MSRSKDTEGPSSPSLLSYGSGEKKRKSSITKSHECVPTKKCATKETQVFAADLLDSNLYNRIKCV